MASDQSSQSSSGANTQAAETSPVTMSTAIGYWPEVIGSGPQAQSGEKAASPHAWITRVMEDEGRAIIRMLWRILGREADVMDAYQDCFCKLAALENRPPLRCARAYVYRTATNIAIEILRGRKRRQQHWPEVAATRAARSPEEPVEKPATVPQNALQSAIAQLPPHLRNVVILRDLGRMSYDQVGKILEISPATARVYRRHAVVKLAGVLDVEVRDD